jgi:alkylated DNA repair dioxygenase AlkB
MQAIPGLIVVPNFISGPGEAALLSIVDANPWMGGMQRRVQHYGYIYDYKRRTVDPSMRLGALPDWAGVVAERLHDDGWIAAAPDQMIVNEYLPGQGIAPHIDCEPCFGDTVLSLSLGSDCVMDLIHTRSGAKIPVRLPRRSLLVMRGEARYTWQHGIAPRKTDRFAGTQMVRARRVSLTFRQVVLTAVP